MGGAAGKLFNILSMSRDSLGRNLLNRDGQSRTTFSGGTALNVKSRTTVQGHKVTNQYVISENFNMHNKSE